MPTSEKITVRQGPHRANGAFLVDRLAHRQSDVALSRVPRAAIELVRRDVGGCRGNRDNDGHIGLGYVGGGRGTVAQEIVETHFASLLIGKSPFQVELIWDQLYSASTMYGRSGVAIEVISADRHRALGSRSATSPDRPVYDLIGGATRERIRAYVTGNLTDRHMAEGFRDVKLALAHGPAERKGGLGGEYAR